VGYATPPFADAFLTDHRSGWVAQCGLLSPRQRPLQQTTIANHGRTGKNKNGFAKGFDPNTLRLLKISGFCENRNVVTVLESDRNLILAVSLKERGFHSTCC